MRKSQHNSGDGTNNNNNVSDDTSNSKETNSSKEKEESLEDLVALLFQQMRDNPPEWTAQENQSEDLKELTKLLNVGNEGAISQDSADKKKSVLEDGTTKKDTPSEE